LMLLVISSVKLSKQTSPQQRSPAYRGVFL
jgi:hypothetical protein